VCVCVCVCVCEVFFLFFSLPHYKLWWVSAISVNILLGVRAALSWFSDSGNSRPLHGWHRSANLRTGRVPTATCRARQAAASGRHGDNVAADSSAAIGRDAVTCSCDVFSDWLRLERLRCVFSDMPGRCAKCTVQPIKYLNHRRIQDF